MLYTRASPQARASPFFVACCRRSFTILTHIKKHFTTRYKKRAIKTELIDPIKKTTTTQSTLQQNRPTAAPNPPPGLYIAYCRVKWNEGLNFRRNRKNKFSKNKKPKKHCRFGCSNNNFRGFSSFQKLQ